MTLRADQIRKWLTGLAKSPGRLRTRKTEKQKYRERADGKDAVRQRRASANRVLTILKAALNRAWREGKAPSNAEWHRVEPFENVDAARIRYLSVAEAQRLVNACDPDFRNLVMGALQTGARYSELAALEVHDFNPDAGTVAIRESKAGEPRHVVLTTEGTALFGQICAGRAGGEHLLQKSNGQTWEKSNQKRRMAEACRRAEITPPISFHGLRHTWASLAVMAGGPLMVMAKNLGHADTRMVEKHYGHLTPSYVADAIRGRGAAVRSCGIQREGAAMTDRPTYAALQARWEHMRAAEDAVFESPVREDLKDTEDARNQAQFEAKRARGPETGAALMAMYEATGDPAFPQAIEAMRRYGFDKSGGSWKLTPLLEKRADEVCMNRMHRLVSRGRSDRRAAATVAVEYVVPGKTFDAVVRGLVLAYQDFKRRFEELEPGDSDARVI